MAKGSSKAARDALSATDWCGIDATTDDDLARQVSANPDAAPDLALEINVRAIRHEAGMTQAQFSAAYDFSIRTVQEWERAPRSQAARRDALARDKADPEGLRKALAAA